MDDLKARILELIKKAGQEGISETRVVDILQKDNPNDPDIDIYASKAIASLWLNNKLEVRQHYLFLAS